MELELAVPRSRRWVVLALACLIVGLGLLPAATVFQLAIIVVSYVMGLAIMLAAVIAVTGRNLW